MRKISALLLLALISVAGATIYGTQYNYQDFRQINNTDTVCDLVMPVNGTSTFNGSFVYGTVCNNNTQVEYNSTDNTYEPRVYNQSSGNELFSVRTFSSNFSSGSAPTGLQDFFPLDESGSKAWNYISSGSSSATLKNTPTQGSSGKVNASYDFEEGNQEYLDTDLASDPNNNDYTFSGWAKFESTSSSNGQGETDVLNVGTNSQVKINIRERNDIWEGSMTGSNGTNFVISGPSVSTGSWTHFALTLDNTNGNMSLYIDGNLQGTKDYSGTAPVSGTNFLIGANIYYVDNNQDDGYMDGKIDHVKTHTRPLSSNEVTALYNLGTDTTRDESSEGGGNGFNYQFTRQLNHSRTISNMVLPVNDSSTFLGNMTYGTFGDNETELRYNKTSPFNPRTFNETSDNELFSIRSQPSNFTSGTEPSDLQDFFPLDEAGSKAVDYADNSNDASATLKNTPTQQAAGRVNYSYDFEESNEEYLDTSLETDVSNSNYTFSGWAKFESTSATNGQGETDVLGVGSSGSVFVQVRELNDNWNSRLSLSNGTTLTIDGPSVETGKWGHFALVIDQENDNMSFYKDGQLQGSKSFQGAAPKSMTNFLIGANNYYVDQNTDDGWMDGKIDSLRVHTSSLTTDEVKTLYEVNPVASDLKPNVSNDAPTNGETINDKDVGFDGTFKDDLQLKNASLYGNFSGSWTRNQTFTISGTTDTVNTTLSLNEGYYKYSFKTFDNNSQSAFGTNKTFTVDYKKPNVTLDSPSDKATVSSPVDFKYNISFFADLAKTELYYNSSNTTKLPLVKSPSKSNSITWLDKFGTGTDNRLYGDPDDDVGNNEYTANDFTAANQKAYVFFTNNSADDGIYVANDQGNGVSSSNFVNCNNNPIVSRSQVETATGNTFDYLNHPSGYHNESNNNWHMVLNAKESSSGNSYIYYANLTGEDEPCSNNWNVYGQPILSPGSGNAKDNKSVAIPDVEPSGPNGMKMLYHAIDDSDGGIVTGSKIMVANASYNQWTNWNKWSSANPVLTTNSNVDHRTRMVGFPDVTWDKNRSSWVVGIATKDDGSGLVSDICVTNSSNLKDYYLEQTVTGNTDHCSDPNNPDDTYFNFTRDWENRTGHPGQNGEVENPNFMIYDNSVYMGYNAFGTWSFGFANISASRSSGWGSQKLNQSSVTNNTLNTISDSFGSGAFKWNIKATDTGGDSSFASSNRTFTIDSSGPNPSIVKPENTTIDSSSTPLNVTTDENANFTYNVDGGTNTTDDEDDQDLNVTLSSLSDGKHTVNVYASDSAGNTGKSSRTFTVSTTPGNVRLNSSVRFNQSNNNAYIITENQITVSDFKVYPDKTTLGGVNWTVNGSTADLIDVNLTSWNSSKGVGNYAFNFSVDTVDGNNVTFDFDGLTNNDLYRVYKAGSIIDQSSVSSSILSFSINAWTDGTYKDIGVLRTDNRYPEFTAVKYIHDFRNTVNQLDFSIDDFSEADINSYTGTGTQNTFTNSSLVVDITPPVDDKYKVTDNKGVDSPLRQINLSETDTGLVENSSFNHDLNTQEQKQEVTVTNDGSKAFDYELNLSTGEDFAGTVSGSSNVTKKGSKQSDFINNKSYSYSVDASEVTLGFNYTGHWPLELDNTAGNQFTGVDTSGGYPSINRCSTSNNTAVDINGNTKTNFSVEQNCDPGDIGNPVQTVNNISNGERVWYNTTDMNIETNKTEDTQIAFRFDESNMKNPDQRDGGSLEAFVSGQNSDNNSELNVSDTGDYLRVTVGTGFQSSSLHTDDTDSSVTYTLSGDSTDESGGGGGGAGDSGSENQIIFFGTQETESGLEQVSFPYGEKVKRNLTVTNERQSETIAEVSVGDGGICDYVSVQSTLNSDQFGGAGTYTIPAATQDLGTVQKTEEFTVMFDLPSKSELEAQGVDDLTCEFDTSSSYGTAEPLVIEKSSSFLPVGDFPGLGGETCFDIPVATLENNNSSGGDGVDTGSEQVCIPNSLLAGGGVFGLLGLAVWWRRQN